MSIESKLKNFVLLHEAIKTGNKIEAQNLILNNVQVNDSRSKCNTPLHWAITQFQDLDIITMLLDKGANMHAINKHNLKPLDIAIENNKTEAALLLIERGALIGEDLNPLLEKTIKQNNCIIFKNLIDNGIQCNQDIDFDSLFKSAVSRGYPKILELILPHRQFSKPSDLYLPRELVIKSGPQYKECIEVLFKWNFAVDPSSNLDEDFVYGAVKYGHVKIVIQLVKLGIDIKLKKSNVELNLLVVACFNKHHEIVEHLLNFSSCVNVTTSNNKMIEKYGYHDTHEFNCPHSFLFDENDSCARSCLQIAVMNYDPKMTKLLLKYGAKIADDPNFFYMTCMAIRCNCEENVRIFLDHGVDVNGISSEEKTLLHFCVLSSICDSKYNIAKLLLEKGATSHIQQPHNPLFFDAVKNRHQKIAQLFLDYNANVHYVCPEGDTALHKAIENRFDIEFVKALLRLNLPVNAVNHNMLTPLFISCITTSENQIEIIKTLLEYNADVNWNDPNFETPLHKACQAQNLEMITIFLQAGADSNVKNKKGYTPLHIVCRHKNDMTASIIKVLLEHNADIEAVDGRGRVPLFMACESGNDIAVKYLLDLHVDANHTDIENLTPLYVAAKHCRNNSEIVKLLLKHKVNVHCINKWGKSVIHAVVENDNAELIKFLARTQVNFNTINKQGRSPLHTAVRNMCVDVTENLIKFGANVNILDKKNRTPLRNAILWRYDFQYESKKNEIEKIIKILKVQIIKLKAAELKVNKENLKLICNSNDNNYEEDHNQADVNHRIDVQQLEVDCMQEIEVIKRENINICNMTLFDLLKKNIHILSRCVENRKIQKTLNLEIYDQKFPLYINILRTRFRDAKLRYRFMTSAKKYFSLNVYPRLPDECVDLVISYLNIKEIKMIIRALRPLNE